MSRSGGAIRGSVQDDETAQAAASIPGAWSGELVAGSVMHGAVCGDATRAAGRRGRAVLRVVASDGAGWWAARRGAGCSVRSCRGTGVSRVRRGPRRGVACELQGCVAWRALVVCLPACWVRVRGSSMWVLHSWAQQEEEGLARRKLVGKIMD